MQNEDKLKAETSTETSLEKKSFPWKKVILVILFVIVSLFGIFFSSTFIRWKSEIATLEEVLYYGQEEIKIQHLQDFYGNDMDLTLDENHALKLYCTSSYGNDCITGDYVNHLENMFRNPVVVVRLVVFIDFILLYLFIKDKEIGNIKVYICSSLILLYGLYGLGSQIYQISDYLMRVYHEPVVLQGKIVRGIVTASDKQFKPVIEYTIDDETFITYLDYTIDDTIEEKKDSEITLYYHKKEENPIEVKRSLLPYLVPTLLSILIIIVSVFYFKLKRKDKYAIS